MNPGTSYGLAFASGINAYLPLFSLAVAARIWPDQFHVNPHFAFITQPWFMVMMAVLTLADLFADKIPVVDHIWDTIHTVIRPVAGAIVAAAASNQTMDNTWWMPLTLALGAGLAGVTHTTKATTRVASSATTVGFLNTALSIAEDIVMMVSVLVSFIAPYIMLVVVVLFVLAFLIMTPKIVRRLRRRRQPTRGSSSGAMPLRHGSVGRN
ncbi:DUF4126 domain-containing protein [Dictyobacter formicarum]|uniref:DUF4126 domain-containing protein n=1 Tax=Dictyobacter formicarum TaxID=2778368 RepID=A0ABQ3VEJ9_9CHLR|nr:DUF4126 domain-containing protein [Dictyobacter formicarum]GHO84169.1 hypothetical protein KSZ_21750 [Dictyobacter formicarum]